MTNLLGSSQAVMIWISNNNRILTPWTKLGKSVTWEVLTSWGHSIICQPALPTLSLRRDGIKRRICPVLCWRPTLIQQQCFGRILHLQTLMSSPKRICKKIGSHVQTPWRLPWELRLSLSQLKVCQCQVNQNPKKRLSNVSSASPSTTMSRRKWSQTQLRLLLGGQSPTRTFGLSLRQMTLWTLSYLGLRRKMTLIAKEYKSYLSWLLFRCREANRMSLLVVGARFLCPHVKRVRVIWS